MRILLVEDNEGDILLTQEALFESNPDTELLIVRNGEDALDYFYRRNRFEDAKDVDLVLLDINIPKINGLEVLQRIRADKDLHPVPVVVLTTSTDENDVRKAYASGANCYVVKDFIFEDLNDVVCHIEEFWSKVVSLPKTGVIAPSGQ